MKLQNHNPIPNATYNVLFSYNFNLILGRGLFFGRNGGLLLRFATGFL